MRNRKREKLKKEIKETKKKKRILVKKNMNHQEVAKAMKRTIAADRELNTKLETRTKLTCM